MRPGHRGEFRVLVAARRTGLGQLRGYLAADLLRRLSQRSGLAPTVVDLAPDRDDDLRALCAELNIHPPRHTLTPPVTADQLAGLFADGIRAPVFDVGVRSADGPGAAVHGLARHWIEVTGGTDGTGRETRPPLLERLGAAQEPLSVRMRLMRLGYGEEAGPDPVRADPGGAGKTLARWRELVARWARAPSGPMSRGYADAIVASFAANLDTAAALRAMDALAGDPAEPDGVKFETFAAADALFGLDLARDIGR